jgi:antitoxin component YwqK of YwqJK toxin-antitoxin module
MLHGHFAQWNDEGKLLGEFEMVQGSGIFRHWFPDGALGTETTYSDGLPHGESKVLDPDTGIIVLRQFYWKGRKVSKQTFVERSVAKQEPR